LNRGDTVAILSPSWGGPNSYPAAYEVGVTNLRETLGVEVKEYSTTRAGAEYLYMHPQERAEDINRAFADIEVKAIFSSIGGDDSVRILPYLDLKTLKRNHKIIMGFSDTTTILSYLNQAGLVTFNGPSVMAGFASLKHLPPSFAQHVKQMLMEPRSEYAYQPFEAIAAATQDWGTPGYSGETTLAENREGWRWLQGDAVAQGQLFGGCLDVLEFLKGTRFWPQPDFWQGKILFLETSEDKPTPDQVRSMLRNYGMQGIFGEIKALLFGKAFLYTAEEKEELDRQIIRVVADEFGQSKLPVITNMDFGHEIPQWILPLGVAAEVNCINKTFRLVESPVE
jgi:muramoyltetrapeptide carboxypeptidase LdcA involved in peptidoglycan recycling